MAGNTSDIPATTEPVASGDTGKIDKEKKIRDLENFKERVEKERSDDLRNFQNLIEARKNRRYDDELLRCLMVGLTLATFLLKNQTHHSYNNFLKNLEQLSAKFSATGDKKLINEFEKTKEKFEKKVEYKNSPSFSSVLDASLYSLAYGASNSLPDLGLERGSADPFYQSMGKNFKKQ